MGKYALTAKVIAVNRVHLIANELYPKLVAAFQPYVGQRIFKADGTLLKKIVEIVPSVDMPNMHNYRINSGYNLAWSIKTSQQDSDTTCLYYEVGLYIANISIGVLTDIMAPEVRRTDYTVAEVKEKQRVLREASDAFNRAKSALNPFEERDRDY
jgi:hypothetical protein